MAFRAHILGASGSGTTTLGKAVSAHLRIPHLDTDDYYWEPTDPPYRTARPIEERLRLLEPQLRSSKSWVLSGSLCTWGDPLIPYFELVVFLSVPQEIRLARLRERERARFGADALAPGGPLHDQQREFLEWAAAYEEGPDTGRSRRRHEEWLTSLPCPVLRLDGERAVEEQLEAVLARRARMRRGAS
jgi:adenylate kinase family enzyme